MATTRSVRRHKASARTVASRPAIASRQGLGYWSPALVGLGSVLLGVPLAVRGPATGPYDDPKAWALPILVGLTAIA